MNKQEYKKPEIICLETTNTLAGPPNGTKPGNANEGSNGAPSAKTPS